MKRLTTIILTFLTCGIVHALPVGNPLDPMIYTNHFCSWNNACDSSCWYDMFNVRLGFYGDYVFNRRMEVEIIHSSVQKVAINTNAGMVVLNFCNRIEAFGTVGTSRILQKTPALSSAQARNPDNLIEDNQRTSMSYSGGARAILWNCNCFYLGAEGQYFYINDQFNFLSQLQTGTLTYYNDLYLPYSEWQVALSTAYLIEKEGLSFIPYAALQFSRGVWDWSKIAGDIDIQTTQLVGWTIGTSLVLNNLIGVSCEARFANEKAFGVMGQLSF